MWWVKCVGVGSRYSLHSPFPAGETLKGFFLSTLTYLFFWEKNQLVKLVDVEEITEQVNSAFPFFFSLEPSMQGPCLQVCVSCGRWYTSWPMREISLMGQDVVGGTHPDPWGRSAFIKHYLCQLNKCLWKWQSVRKAIVAAYPSTLFRSDFD